MGELNNILVRNAIVLLEGALIEEQNLLMVHDMMRGRLGARIMGGLEDGDLEDDGESSWERVEVDIDGYLRMGDLSFRRHFRLRKPTYEALLHTLAHYLLDSGRVLRVGNSLDVPLLMVLWVLANPDTFRSVALRFGVLPGIVHFHYAYIIECLREMAPMYVQWPNEEERDHIKARFEAYSRLPGVVGVLDGTHQVVTAPTTQKESFRNRHHTYSYNSSVVCDHNLLIRDLHIGEVGAMHDSRVFRRSPLYEKLVADENEEYLRPDEHIIGDKAYTLMDCVLVPFKNYGNLTAAQRLYNYALSKSRMRIEHAFGKAFGQWRRMKMLHSVNAELAVDHFTACYVLHNFMILDGEKLLDLDDPTQVWEDEDDPQDGGEDDDLEDDDDDEAEGGVNFNRQVVAAQFRGREKRIQIVNDLLRAHLL